MSNENSYENFRTILALNLCTVTQDPALLGDIMSMVDMTMSDFEISHKSMDIIPAEGVPEVVKYYLATKTLSGRSQKTLKQYHYKLINFFNTVKKSFIDITALDIRNYLSMYKINHNASNTYLDNIRITLNSFFQWLVDDGYLTRNPCAKVDKFKCQVKRRESFSTYSLEELRWNCTSVREKALIDFLYSTGCRVSECADILLTDIDWNNNTVLIRHGKGDKERTVRFNDESKVSLKAYVDSRNDDTPALWVSMKAPHQQLQTHALENIVKKAGERAGLHAYPHKLRHTFATVGLRNGISLDKLQVLMGHVSPRTTMIYADEDRTQIHMEHTKAFS